MKWIKRIWTYTLLVISLFFIICMILGMVNNAHPELLTTDFITKFANTQICALCAGFGIFGIKSVITTLFITPMNTNKQATALDEQIKKSLEVYLNISPEEYEHDKIVIENIKYSYATQMEQILKSNDSDPVKLQKLQKLINEAKNGNKKLNSKK